MKRTIPYLASLRLIATFSVVLLHSSATYYDNGIYSQEDYSAFAFYDMINVFAVPVFVMITGALFLNPNKMVDFRLMATKYIRRIALALLLFGLPMCIAETLFVKGNIMDAFLDFLTGHSWAHMWYLYMLVGLYILIPILKPFVNVATKRMMVIAILVFFVMCSVLPAINNILLGGVKSWMMFQNNPYILYLFLGYYLHSAKDAHTEWWKAVLLILISVTIIIIKMGYDGKITYYEPVSICLATGVFLFFRNLNTPKADIADKMGPYCFGIYLVHPVFYNATAKVFHVCPADYLNAWIAIPLFAFLVFFLSLLTVFGLRKIPLLRRYVL